MVVRFVQRISFAAALSAAAWSIPTSTARAQSCAPPPPAACPAPAPSMQGRESPRTETATPSTTAGLGTSDQSLAQAPQLSAQAGVAGGEESSAIAPNMLGDLLRGYRSTQFGYIRASSFINIEGVGATSITNPSVAENNSPEPRDRISLRYNHFNDAQFVVGFGDPVGGTVHPRLQNYDVDQYTFGIEKTFLDGWASAELRVPFATGVSSRLNLSAGNITGSHFETLNGAPLAVFDIAPTPQNSLGSRSTEFGDMTLIFKGLLYESCSLLVSGGAATSIPTGPDTNVHVVDFGGPGANGANHLRLRDFHMKDETWGLNPFVAFLALPTERWFAQGFVQFDCPLNKSSFSFTDRAFAATGGTPDRVPTTFTATDGVTYVGAQSLPISVAGHIADQYLMHINVGTGYWLVQNRDAKWITGFAPTVELHLTSTLNNADIVTLPGDFSTVLNPADNGATQIQEPRPRIGNLANRVDILDMTVGSTMTIGDNATLAMGFAFPLKSNRDDRVFDWEAQLQFNYYFGGPRSSAAMLGR